MKEQVQLKAVAMELAKPLALDGNISDMMSQGIGPRPRENPMMYITILLRESHPRSDLAFPSTGKEQKLCSYILFYII